MIEEFIPFGSEVLIRPTAQPKNIRVLQSPGAQEEEPLRGEVVAMGNDVTRPILIGMRVGWRKFSGTKLRVGGEDLMLFRQDEIAGEWRREY